jgi:TonB family protein
VSYWLAWPLLVSLHDEGPNHALQPTTDRREHLHMTASTFDSEHSLLPSAVAQLCLVRSMKPLLFVSVFLAALSVAAAQTTPSTPPLLRVQSAKALAIFAPSPRYPTDERGRRLTGRGLVVMEVDQKTGWVTSAKMEKSTGSKLLDDAALETFRQWRFRPGKIRRVTTPITFTP